MAEMEECTHNCETCGASCSSRDTGKKKDMHEPVNASSTVKRVIGVVSGKGGVGKSLVTSLMAVMFSRKGYNTAILDADITGPSIPKAFGLNERAMGSDNGILPVKTHGGINVMSLNLLLEHDTDPVVWRGPILAGTGDVPLTVFQTLPLDGIIIVTSPQELVSMIVEKAVKMANMMNIPILGVVENMSYYVCPDCGKKHYPFGESKLDKTAKEYGLDILARLPIDPDEARACDEGKIETVINDDAKAAADKIEEKCSVEKE